jgi:hypothetical protein
LNQFWKTGGVAQKRKAARALLAEARGALVKKAQVGETEEEREHSRDGLRCHLEGLCILKALGVLVLQETALRIVGREGKEQDRDWWPSESATALGPIRWRGRKTQDTAPHGALLAAHCKRVSMMQCHPWVLN